MIRITGVRRALQTAVCLLAAAAVLTPPVEASDWGGATAGRRGETAPGLRVIPFPGTPDVAASSEVIFSALAPSALRSVVVTGSRSGAHAGRLAALPDGAGSAFIPDRPFSAGERVQVRAVLSSPDSGTASADRSAAQLAFAFRVATEVSSHVREAGPASSGAFDQVGHWLSQPAPGPNQHFHSAPNLHPPVITVTHDPDQASGEIFLAVQRAGQIGPMILDGQGRLVWFHPVASDSGKRFASDLAVQHYRGQPVLTWWQGVALRRGEDVIMNTSYRKIAIVRAGNGYPADFHEFQITPQDTALLDTGTFTYTNLTSVGGPPRGVVLDDIIQELDIRTGKVLWEWHSLGHVPVSASYYPYDPSKAFYDYFHLNSIQQLPNGNLLISARHTWSVYEISRRTGRVIWTLGGRYSSFRMGRGTNFEWQHDARLHGQVLSLFDDGAYPPEESQSSAKYLRLDTANMTASLTRRFTHHPPILTGAAGNAQVLPNGNLFVGWGAVPVFSEYSPSGSQIFNGSFPYGLTSYRAFRFAWVGRPRTRPSVAVSRTPQGHTSVYASWNGATQVAAWRILGGPSPHRLKPLGVTAVATGFETTIKLAQHPRYLAVQAVGRRGNALRTSAAARGPR